MLKPLKTSFINATVLFILQSMEDGMSGVITLSAASPVGVVLSLECDLVLILLPSMEDKVAKEIPAKLFYVEPIRVQVRSTLYYDFNPQCF